MAESEYKVLKTRIEELIENIESIDKEAASFSSAKAELLEIASNLHVISGDLAKAIKTSEAILEQVESIGVTSTLQSLKESADKYVETSVILHNNIKGTYEKQSADFLTQSKAGYSDHAQEIQTKIDLLIADSKKKMFIMGGISIACSIVALICAFI